MRKYLPLFFIVLFSTANTCCTVNSVLASSRDEALKDVSIIIEKALQAYGGKEHLQLFANRSIYIGEISEQNNGWQKHAYKYVRKDGFWREDVESSKSPEQTKIETTLYEGKNCWQYSNQAANNDSSLPDNSDFNKKQTNSVQLKTVSPELAQSLENQFDSEPFILSKWQNPSYSFKLCGRSNYKQIPAYVIEIKENNDRTITAYIDSSNFLILALVYQSYSLSETNNAAKKVTITKDFSENRPVLGSIWPFKEMISINKEPETILELTEIKLADEIKPDYFVPPIAETGSNTINSTYRTSRLLKAATVPFEYCESEIICRAKLSKIEPLWFLIDTGRSNSVIERSFATQILSGSNNSDAARYKIQNQSVQIDNLELGELLVNNINAEVADLSPQSKQIGRSITGIIGMDVLSNYLITLDYAKPCITFADAYSGARPDNACTVAFAQPINSTGAVVNEPLLPRVKISLPGSDNQIFLVDTGAAFNHISAQAAKRHAHENLEKSTHSIEATGLDGRTIQLGILRLDPIIIGSYKVHKVKFTYPMAGAITNSGDSLKASSDILNKNLDVCGILGNPFFEHFLVTVDSSFHRLFLKPNAQFEIIFEIEAALKAGDDALYTKRDFRQSEFAYEKALMLANNAHDLRFQALGQERMGNLRRVMSHDLKRPEHAQASYKYFKKANDLATQGNFKDVQGRILADWSLLYSENGQVPEAQQTMQKALLLAPKDAVVNIDYAVHLFRERAYAEAQKYIEKALFYDPGNWQALWYQVKLSEMFQDIAKEKSTLREILQRYPWSKVAESKLKALENVPVNTNADISH